MRFVLLALTLAACAQADEPVVHKVQRLPEKWITTGPPQWLSDTEDMRLLRFASPTGVDTVCVLYRNSAYKTTQIVCPEELPDLSAFTEAP